MPASALYLDTSVVLRATLERGMSPDVESRIAAAPSLVTSRLSLVESARALLRVQSRGTAPETQLADIRRELNRLWSRCELWELSAAVCELASRIVPDSPLRALDALHLATFVLARGRIEGLELLTVDKRLEDAARSA